MHEKYTRKKKYISSIHVNADTHINQLIRRKKHIHIYICDFIKDKISYRFICVESMLFPCEFLLIFICVVSSFSPDTSSYDAYGLKIGANEILFVESIPSDSSFFVRLSPFNYSLSCTIAYNDSNQYVYSVSLASQVKSNDSIRFVFIGINTQTNVPFIGSLTYTGILGSTYVNTVKPTRKSIFPCNGWNSSNYRVHQFNQFASDDSINNDFYVVTVS
jgi:hypothetical protein